MSVILCPQCGTEVDYSSFKNQDNPQCTICGKILLAEALKVKEKFKNAASLQALTPRSKEDSRKMGKKLQNLGDDDLFGELEPFSLEDDHGQLEDVDTDFPAEPKSRTVQHEGDLDDGDVPKFENPMEKSSLMKKLKDDQDLFGSLDG